MPLELEDRKGIFYVRGTVHGLYVCRSTKTRNRKIAETIRIQTESRLVEEATYGKKKVATFDEAASLYMKNGGSSRFIEEVRADGKVVGMIVRFRGKRLHTFTQADLDLAAAEMYPGAARETLIRQFYGPFIAVWRSAVQEKWADPTMWRRPKKPKGTGVIQRAARVGSFPVAYDHAARFVTEMSSAPAYVMTALFYTGMRPIELFALECADVNVAGRWLVVRNSKTGEPRGVPMHEFVAPLFESLIKRGGRVFRTHRGGDYHLSDPEVGKPGGQLKTAIAGAARRSGIDNVSPYTGRHSASTGLVMAGVHPHIKDQILGHAADDMSRLYTNLPQATLIEAINKLPVPDLWRTPDWWADPLGMSGKIVTWGKPAAAMRKMVAGDV